jgi:hypothetical protein
MIYTTQAGIGLGIGRIDRQHIDNLLARRPMPEPPTRTVQVWGGIEEEEPLWNDPAYQVELTTFWLQLGREQLELVTPAVTILSGAESVDLRELEEAGISRSDPAGRLRAGVLGDPLDLQAVVELVFYLSTVTQRGIDEATAAFRVLWLDKPVLAWKVPGAPAEYAPVYRDRQAARSGGYSWERFGRLTGPEQSAEVAFFLIERRLGWLMSRMK